MTFENITLNWFDGLVAFLLLFTIYIGYVRGFVKELFSLLSWIATVILTFVLYEYVGNLFADYIKQQTIRNALGSVISFVVILTFFLIVTSILSEKVSKTKAKYADKTLGGCFGACKAFAILSFLYLLIFIFDPQKTHCLFMREAWVGSIFQMISDETCEFIKENKDSNFFKMIYQFIQSKKEEEKNKKKQLKEEQNTEAEESNNTVNNITAVENTQDEPEESQVNKIEKIREDYKRKNKLFSIIEENEE